MGNAKINTFYKCHKSAYKVQVVIYFSYFENIFSHYSSYFVASHCCSKRSSSSGRNVLLLVEYVGYIISVIPHCHLHWFHGCFPSEPVFSSSPRFLLQLLEKMTFLGEGWHRFFYEPDALPLVWFKSKIRIAEVGLLLAICPSWHLTKSVEALKET